MNNLSPFCTCTDYTCPLHPTNHEKGCAPCIAKNLKLREIPSCFFNRVHSREKRDTFFFEDFAKAVLRAEDGEQHHPEDPAEKAAVLELCKPGGKTAGGKT